MATEKEIHEKMKYLVEVEKGVEACDGTPSLGPTYRSLFAKDGFPKPEDGMNTCWDIFRQAFYLFILNFGYRKFFGFWI